MKHRYFTIALLVLLFIPNNFHAAPQQRFSLHVFLSLDTRFQKQIGAQQGQTLRSLTTRLYYPKSAGKPVMNASPDSAGNVRFSDLPGGSFLLEVHIGDQLLYQRKLWLESDVVMAVPIGQLTLVDQVTIDSNSSQYLRGKEFNSNAILGVGALDNNIGPRSRAVGLTITSGKTRLKATMIPPKLATSFKANGQIYTVSCMLRRGGNKSVLDCEVFK